MGVSTFNSVSITSKKMFGSTYGPWPLSNLMKVATKMYQTPFSFIETLVILDISSIKMLHLMAKICEGEGTPRMVVTLN
jgi:hypothetical protein